MTKTVDNRVEKEKARESLLARRSQQLCLYRLTSRPSKGPANINSGAAAAGAGRQPLAYRDLSTLNNGSSDARAFYQHVYISALSIFISKENTPFSTPFVLLLCLPPSMQQSQKTQDSLCSNSLALTIESHYKMQMKRININFASDFVQ